MSGKSACRVDRQAQYKTGKRDWKDMYRRRCLERLRESRMELLAKRRGITEGAQQRTAEADDGRGKEDDGEGSDSFIRMVMSSELKALRHEEGVEDEMDFFDPVTGEIDMTLALIEEIQEEMKAEEAKLLAEFEVYQSSLEREEAALCEAIDLLTTQTVCPMCCKSPLMENKGVIFCKCGLRICTEQDGITLAYVERQLMEGRELHQCEGQPVFSVQEKFGITSLLMTCQECDFMFIVV